MSEPAKMIVHYKDGKEMMHTSIPTVNLVNHLKFYKECGYECEVYEMDEYWKKVHNGEFSLCPIKKNG